MNECVQASVPLSDVSTSIIKLGNELEITRDLFNQLKSGLNVVLSPEMEKPAQGFLERYPPKCVLSHTIAEITCLICDLKDQVSDTLERLQL